MPSSVPTGKRRETKGEVKERESEERRRRGTEGDISTDWVREKRDRPVHTYVYITEAFLNVRSPWTDTHISTAIPGIDRKIKNYPLLTK
jgi:hypothetical protein